MKILNILFDWMGADGMKHCITSALLTAVLLLVTIPFGAAFVALLIGLAKEAYDKISGEGVAEGKDIMCNAIGIAIAILANIA